MFKDDRMISILSGVVLMLGLGILAQRTDLFSGLLGSDPDAVELRDDEVVADTGLLTRIDVLSNDIGVDSNAARDLTIVEAPACGRAFVQAGSIQYLGDAECVGEQSIRYAVAAGEDAASANVRLFVRRRAELPVPVASATDGATPDPETPETPAPDSAGASGGTDTAADPDTGPDTETAAAGTDVSPEAQATPVPVIVGSAPAPVLAPPADPVAPDMPEALRRPAADGASTAPSVARDPSTVAGGVGTERRPAAPERVPVPLIGMDQAAAAELPPDMALPSIGEADPLGAVPADLAAVEPLPAADPVAPVAPGPAGEETLAALGPALRGEVPGAGAEPLGDEEPSVTFTSPGSPSLPGTPLGADAKIEIGGFGAVPDLALPTGSAVPVDGSFVAASAPGHPLTLAHVDVAALSPLPAASSPPAGDPTLGPVARSTAPSGLPDGLGGVAAVVLPLTDPGDASDPLALATEPAFKLPDAIVLAALGEEAAGLVSNSLAPVPGAAAAPALPGGAVPGLPQPLLPGAERDPLADAAEPAPVQIAALSAEPASEAALPAFLPLTRVIDTANLTAGSVAIEPAPAVPALPGAVPHPAPEPAPATADPSSAPEMPGTDTDPAGADPAGTATDVAALPPADIVCTDVPRVRTIEQPAAFTTVAIEAPCHGGSIARIVHEGVTLGIQLDREGKGQIGMPGLRTSSPARIDFDGGVSVPVTLTFRDTGRIQRVVVAWSAPVKFGLHAFEGGARVPGDQGHVGPSQPRSFGEVRITGGGFLTTYPSVGDGTDQLSVYTLWQSRRGPVGIVRMELDFVSRREGGGAAACGAEPNASPEFALLISNSGQSEPLSRHRIVALECAAVPSQGEGFVSGALPNLVISKR